MARQISDIPHALGEREALERRFVGKPMKSAVDVARIALERRSSARSAQDVVADIPPGLFQSRASLWC